MLRSGLSLSLLSLLSLAGCANGGGGGGMPDAGTDARVTTRDAGGGDDAGETSCGATQHACGGGCIDDLDNLPVNGCRLGCGEPCPTPPDGVASCDPEGLCTVGCEPPFVFRDGMCTCAPQTCADWGWTCGAPDDGCGTTLDCGSCTGAGVCAEGMCACMPDAAERNDSFIDADGAPLLVDIPNEDWARVFTEYGLHDATDEDYFRFRVADSGAFNPEPEITVTLRGIPTGSDYDLAVSWVCDGTPNRSTCTAGAQSGLRGVTCSSSSSGTTSETVTVSVECRSSLTTDTDDSGTLYVHVSPATFGGSCMPYELDIDITN